MQKKQEKITDFNTITLKLASPERINEWSYGEVTKPETINYRSGRSERGGLFDERIFGPEKDFECYCGKYKRIRYKDIVCEKCGVEVTRSIVRRERMGHIALATPVAHIWFFRGIPSRMGTLLDLPIADLEKVIYFAGYIVTKVNEDEKEKVMKRLDEEYKNKSKSLTEEEDRERLKESLAEARRQLESLTKWKVVDEVSYHRLSLKFGTCFEAGIGAEAVYNIFKSLKLDDFLAELEERMSKASSVERQRLQRRHNLVKSMIRANVRPEWMFLTLVPVIPPALRPMVPLDGGRHATSDVNDLYRRVINRNNRLHKLVDLNAPEVILRNEKRILQEAVDALIDNSIRQNQNDGAQSMSQRRPLKSLADSLRGKQGRFRQNLLGKRVDYSGRSVIVVGPELKISQCGLPKHMALELFRPFVISKILEQELAFNIRGAGRLIDEGVAEVWAILEGVIEGKYVLLNRAPTLHRLGIQAFQPVLIEGNALQVHPVVCSAFNADFDGDQMAVHVPLSDAAQKEAALLIASNKNLLKPGSGDPVVNMKMDIVLGSYWVTKDKPDARGEGKFYQSPNAAIMAYDFDDIEIQAKIKVLGGKPEKYGDLSGKVFETTVGRILFNTTLPRDYPFINHAITSKEIGQMIENMIAQYGVDAVPEIIDKVKNFGFKYATMSGITWGINDVSVPEQKKAFVAEAKAEADRIEESFAEGLLSENERYRMIIEIWNRTKSKLQKTMLDSLPQGGSVSDMIISGARGSVGQVTQMVGMKGIITNPAGREIDFPIIPSYKEGLSPIEYFVTTHGSRKGLADTALNTAKAGYLTRKLVDVAQDVVTNQEDCGDTKGKVMTKDHILGFDSGISQSIKGRYLLRDVKTANGEVMFKKGHLLSKTDALAIEEAGLVDIHVRTPLTCQASKGICRTCYGMDPGRGGLVKNGEPVGIVAAQAIGEPGTQLTMRTKHAGGVGGGAGDIVGGLPRVEEIFERRSPKNPATICEVDGEVMEVKSDSKGHTVSILIDLESRKKASKSSTIEYSIPLIRSVNVKKGETVKRGDLLSDGSVDLVDYYALAGREKVEDYIIKEINTIYELQGVSISRKHIELMIRQMFSRRRIKDSADTKFTVGEIVEMVELEEENAKAEEVGSELAVGEQIILGISEVALSTSSFLSAVSFQHATRVLIDAAIKGSVDKLRGLKENVIIGRLIPAGTGLLPDFDPVQSELTDNFVN